MTFYDLKEKKYLWGKIGWGWCVFGGRGGVISDTRKVGYRRQHSNWFHCVGKFFSRYRQLEKKIQKKIIYMLFSRMRDLQAVDSLLLKELKSCCAKECNFLPREAGLKLIESSSVEVTHWPNLPVLVLCANIWYSIQMGGIFLCAWNIFRYGAFSELPCSVFKMQRQPSGRAVGPDQFLWLQYPNICSCC